MFACQGILATKITSHVTPGHGRCGERSKTDGWRYIGHDAEVEDKEVHCDQRHDQAVLLAERYDHGCQQRGHDDVASVSKLTIFSDNCGGQNKNINCASPSSVSSTASGLILSNTTSFSLLERLCSSDNKHMNTLQP